jgi:hypothetical protein
MRSTLRGRRFPLSRAAILLALALAMPVGAGAVIITTTDPAVVAAFQSGATVEDFDDLTALAITSYAAGQTVPAGAQFSSRGGATQPTFHSGGASPNDPVGNPGTPIGIFAPSGAIAGDVSSAPNVAGPLVINSDEAFNFGFMEVIFPSDVSRVGFWLTEGSVLFQLRDATGSPLTTGDFEVTASAGQFVGISRSASDVKVAALVGLTEAFTIDDFTFGTPVPEPGAAACLALAVAAGWVASRTRRDPSRPRRRARHCA